MNTRILNLSVPTAIFILWVVSLYDVTVLTCWKFQNIIRQNYFVLELDNYIDNYIYATSTYATYNK
jgi:type IV secretory pathway TraG/TraD family ATPase VirD4